MNLAQKNSTEESYQDLTTRQISTARQQNRATGPTIGSVLTSPGAKAALGILIALTLWELLVRIFEFPAYMLVGPISAFVELGSRPEFYVEHSWVTLQEALAGFALGAFLGVLFGSILYYLPFLRHFIYPMLIAIDTIPKVALAPLFILWFGFGFESKAFISMLIAFFPLVINTYEGLTSVPAELKELARINKASRWMQMSKIELIYALPYIFTGMKIAISMAVGGAVVGEFIAGSSGLGFVILLANSQVNLPSMFAAFMVLAVISLLLFALIDFLSRKLVPWRTYVK